MSDRSDTQDKAPLSRSYPLDASSYTAQAGQETNINNYGLLDAATSEASNDKMVAFTDMAAMESMEQQIAVVNGQQLHRAPRQEDCFIDEPPLPPCDNDPSLFDDGYPDDPMPPLPPNCKRMLEIAKEADDRAYAQREALRKEQERRKAQEQRQQQTQDVIKTETVEQQDCSTDEPQDLPFTSLDPDSGETMKEPQASQLPFPTGFSTMGAPAAPSRKSDRSIHHNHKRSAHSLKRNYSRSSIVPADAVPAGPALKGAIPMTTHPRSEVSPLPPEDPNTLNDVELPLVHPRMTAAEMLSARSAESHIDAVSGKNFTPMPSFAETKAHNKAVQEKRAEIESALFRAHGAPKGIPSATAYADLYPEQQEQMIAKHNERDDDPFAKLNPDVFTGAYKPLADPKFEEAVNHSFKKPEEIRRQAKTSSAVSSLVSLIEKLTKTNFLDEPMSEEDRMNELRQLRRSEALTVVKELRSKAEDNYEKYINGLLESGQLNRNYTFEKLTWDALNDSARRKSIFFLNYIEKYGLDNIILIFSGNMGSGKTCLSHAIANSYFDSCLKAHRLPKYNKALPFCVITDLEDIRNTKFFDRNETSEMREERQEKFRRYCEVDLLILDTLCADGQALDSFSQKILAELLEQRALKKLPVVLGLGINLETIEDRIGSKCVELLKCFRLIPVYLQGGSRRSFSLLTDNDGTLAPR